MQVFGTQKTIDSLSMILWRALDGETGDWKRYPNKAMDGSPIPNSSSYYRGKWEKPVKANQAAKMGPLVEQAFRDVYQAKGRCTRAELVAEASRRLATVVKKAAGEPGTTDATKLRIAELINIPDEKGRKLIMRAAVQSKDRWSPSKKQMTYHEFLIATMAR